MTEETLEALEEITMDSGKAQAILDASRSSMGKELLVFINQIAPCRPQM